MVIRLNHRRGHSSSLLKEASRRELNSRSRKDSKDRYAKRLNYQVSNYRGVNLAQLFENDYFLFNTPINDYMVTLAFPGVLTELRNVAKATNGDPKKFNLQLVIKALRQAFDKTDDLKVRCTCADFKYRFMYYADKYNYLYGYPDPGTEVPPKKTNPNNNIGAVCKHLDLFLANKKWLVKAASVINSLIRTYPEKAAVYLYDEDEISNEDDEEDIEETEEESEPEEAETPAEEVPEESEESSADESDENPED